MHRFGDMLDMKIGGGSIGPYDVVTGAKVYWDGIAEERILLRRCIDCGRHSHPRQEACENCFSPRLEWVQTNGSGTIYSFSTIHRAPHQRPVPYTVGLIMMPEQVCLFAEIEMTGEIAIGKAVTPFFVPTERGTLLKFRLASTGNIPDAL
jgi:uncharacterized OB-fold protein